VEQTVLHKAIFLQSQNISAFIKARISFRFYNSVPADPILGPVNFVHILKTYFLEFYLIFYA